MKPETPFYITTPIYYPNAEPHLGHAYTTVFADILARYHRLIGDDTFYLTGTDEHGLKLQRAAEAKGVTPKEFVDSMVAIYRNFWGLLNISYNRFVRTTDEDHIKVVKYAAEVMYRKGLIYKGNYSGWYCVDCEKFYSASEYLMIDGRPHCPIHRKPLEWTEESTYYFRLSEFREYLLNLLKNKDIVYPKHFRQEVINKIVGQELLDISIARPKERVWWGIELPFDKNYTVYVWFDALLNYLTGINYLSDKERFRRYWSSTHHVIGKDILWFHTAVWFAMLKALDIDPPKKVLVHSFIINKGLKMGKSSGNVVRIEDLLGRYLSSDGVRYLIARIFNLGKDVEVSTSLLDSIYNSELADNLGNLIRRVGVLIKKKLKGTLSSESIDNTLTDKADTAVHKFNKLLGEEYEISTALQEVMGLLKEANAYINSVRPWELSDPSKELYTLMEVVKVAINLLYPVIPESVSKVAESFSIQLGNPLDISVDVGKEYVVKEAPILFKKVR